MSSIWRISPDQVSDDTIWLRQPHKQREEQVRLLKAFLDGSLTVPLQGSSKVVTLKDVHDDNLGADLRDKVPVAIELCGCKWED